MTTIFPYIPDWLDYLVGWNGGIVVGLVVGWYLRSCYWHIQPWSHSQEHPVDGEAGGL